MQVYNQETSLQGLVDPASGSSSALFVRVNSQGSTALEPETSTNFNMGAVFTPTDNLTFRVDYWRFEYEDVITVENAQGKLNDNPNGADIIRDSAGTLSGVNVAYLNAQEVTTDGIDVTADWMIDRILDSPRNVPRARGHTRCFSFKNPATRHGDAARASSLVRNHEIAKNPRCSGVSK